MPRVHTVLGAGSHLVRRIRDRLTGADAKPSQGERVRRSDFSIEAKRLGVLGQGKRALG